MCDNYDTYLCDKCIEKNTCSQKPFGTFKYLLVMITVISIVTIGTIFLSKL